jgi:hypothetical protein
VNAAGGVFGAAPFVVIKSCGVVVEVFFGPAGFKTRSSGQRTRYQRLRFSEDNSGMAIDDLSKAAC